MSEPLRSDAGLREMLRHIRWSFGVCRMTSPLPYAALWLPALVGTAFPAGAALAVRGLVNAVNEGLAKPTAFQPAAVYLWLLLGFAATVGTVGTGSALAHLRRRVE